MTAQRKASLVPYTLTHSLQGKKSVNLLPCIEAFDAVYFCVLCLFFLMKLKIIIVINI